MDLNWEAIGAIGEIVGAFAVVATLLFLSVQVRQNSRSLRMSTRSRATETFSNVLSTAQDPAVAEAAVRALLGFDSLKPTEQLQIASLNLRVWRVVEDVYFQYREGDLDADTWAEHETYLLDMFQYDHNCKMYEQRKSWLDPRFVEYIDSKLAGHTQKVKLEYARDEANQ